MVDLEKELNIAQLDAVTSVSGPVLVLAGAGSGKTRVITYRIYNLIKNHGIYENKILAVTFTNKAAKEMKERLSNLIGNDSVWVSTFHSAGLKILRRNAHHLGFTNSFVIYDDLDSKSVLKKIIKELALDKEDFPLKKVKSIIQKAKNNYLSSTKFFNELDIKDAHIYEDIFNRYTTELIKSNAMDFADLLLNTYKLFKDHPQVLKNYQENLEHVLVDEFQDTNLIQYEIIKMLSAKHKNIFVVGDDDQSIYSFRGAEIENILNFEKDFNDTQVFRLEQNYRSHKNILEIANSVITKNPARYEKKLWTNTESENKTCFFQASSADTEADYIVSQINTLSGLYKFSDFALIYRVNAQSRALEEALIGAAIPYHIFGGMKFYDRKEVKDLLAYLKMIINPDDNASFYRVYNTPTRGIGNKTFESIYYHAKAQSISLYKASLEICKTNLKVKKFIELINDFIFNTKTMDLPKLIDNIIDKSGYKAALEKSKDPLALSRLENMYELQNVTKSYTENSSTIEAISKLLDRVALVSDSEIENEDKVSLMSFHLTKGLEFPVVFLTGLEEGLLPHTNSLNSIRETEEERRLFYVGITRAKERLFLTAAKYRNLYSANSFSSDRQISSFVEDIPLDLFVDQTFSNIKIDKDLDDDLAYSSWGYKKKKKRKTINNFDISQLSSADSLTSAGSKEGVPQIELGSKIIHDKFGLGIVSNISGNFKRNPFKVKMEVVFNEIGLKKIIYNKSIKLVS